MTALLSDPRLFNYVLMTLNAFAACRWAYEGHWVNAVYWTAALALTACVTWGMR